MKRFNLAAKIIGGLLILLALSACLPEIDTPPASFATAEQTKRAPDVDKRGTATPMPVEPTSTADVMPLEQRAVDYLAQTLNVKKSEVQIVDVIAKEWPNACLGIVSAGEVCADVITPGYLIHLKVGDVLYEIRANQTGSMLRMANEPKGGEVTMPDPQNYPQAVAAARDALAKSLALNVQSIEVEQFEAVDWPDACLGVSRPGVACATVITPGYRVILNVQGKTYEFHTNKDGRRVVQARTGSDQTALPAILVWQDRSTGICTQVEINEKALRLGQCGGAMLNLRIDDAVLQSQLMQYVNEFQSFQWEDENSSLKFNGRGARVADEAEQRKMVDWIRMLLAAVPNGEAQTGMPLLTWERQGGIAGFCDTVTVYPSGWAFVDSCKATEKQSIRLNAAQLMQVSEWMDRYAPFEMEQKDAGVADAMMQKLVFAGMGSAAADMTVQQAMVDFVNELISQSGSVQ